MLGPEGLHQHCASERDLTHMRKPSPVSALSARFLCENRPEKECFACPEC